MRKEDIYTIIMKYLDNNASKEEEDLLLKWIETPKNKRELEELISANYIINKEFKNFKGETSLKEFFNKIESKKVKKLRFVKYRAIAASIILLISLTIIFNKINTSDSKQTTTTTTTISNDVKIGTDKATLTLEDGTNVVLEKGKEYVLGNISSNGKEIIYNNGSNSKEDIVYNYLTIPRGGQYFIKLSDGTQVWLNSESKLKYPVRFIEGKTRTVELIYGEAFFDVSPSKDHKGAKFKVFHNRQEVSVLGTEFNIKAYQDDTNIYTTLVEGLVAIDYDGNKRNLTPGQQSNVSIKSNVLSVKEVDVFNAISWKEGVFSFEDMSFKDVMKTLSRWYDIDVVFKNKDVVNEEFVGVLDKDQKIQYILENIKSFGIITNYEITGKKVILE